MADKQEISSFTPEQLDSMSFEDRLNYFDSQKIIDITSGLHHLIHNADELFDLYMHMLESDRGRLPILIMNDGTVFMTGGNVDRSEHAQVLLNSQRKRSDIKYATGIEYISSNAEPPYVELQSSNDEGEVFKTGNKIKITIGKQSDKFVTKNSILSQDGIRILNQIFGQGKIEGVKLYTPKLWKNPDSEKQPA